MLVMKAAIQAIGYHSYKWSNFKVLKYCKWLNGIHNIYYATLCFVHKINFEMEPKSLVSQFIFNNDLKNNIRFTKSPTDNKYKCKSNITSDSLLFNGIYLYNKIPDYIKTKNLKQFKSEIKSYIINKLTHNKITTKRDYG